MWHNMKDDTDLLVDRTCKNLMNGFLDMELVFPIAVVEKADAKFWNKPAHLVRC